MADGRHFEKFYRYISAGNHPISTKFGVLMQIVLPRSATQQYTIPFTVFLIFHNWDRWGKRKTNRFSHFARSEGYRNRFVSRLSHFVLNTAIGKTEYGFVFRFHWYRTEWGKQIHGIYTDPTGMLTLDIFAAPLSFFVRTFTLIWDFWSYVRFWFCCIYHQTFHHVVWPSC